MNFYVKTFVAHYERLPVAPVTTQVLVPLKVIGPGFGASTRVIALTRR